MADLYPVTTPGGGSGTGIPPSLFPFAIESQKLFKQLILRAPLASITGLEPTRPIVTRNVKMGDGWSYRVAKLNQLNQNNTVENFDQVRGQAQTQSVDYDEVILKGLSNPVIIKGKELLGYGTPINLPAQVNSQLLEACKIKLNYDIFNAITTGNYPSTATQKPSYDRVILAGVSPTRSTYNGYAGLNAALNTLSGGPAYNQNGLSATALFNLQTLATNGGKPDGAVKQYGVTVEDTIPPAYMKLKNGWDANQYLFFGPHEAYISLFNDPFFMQTTIARGTISNDNQPEIITGANYVGDFDGLQLFKVNELSNYVISANGQRYAWCFLIGGGAVSLGWAEQTWIAHDQDRIDRSDIWTTHEIRGQKCIKFAAKQQSTITAGNATVEQGIIHVFTRLS